MKTFLSILLIMTCSLLVTGQNPNGDYNPYVGSGNVTPSPLWPLEVNSEGIISFEVGNTGADPLNVHDDQYVTLTLTLSYGEPVVDDPINAVSGTAAGLFSWSYSAGTYTAKQISAIPSGYSGIVTIGYSVTDNSATPGINGFNVNIAPAPYQTNSNLQADDAVSFYTYTTDEYIAPSAPTELNLLSISEQHVTITWSASSGVNGVASYKIYRDDSVVGETADLSYTDRDSTFISGESYIYAVSAVDSAGNESERSEPLNVTILFVNEFGVNQLLIKPNPSNGMFYVDLDSAYGEFILEIISARGDIVVQRKVEFYPQVSEVLINNSFLDTGIYTVRLYNQNMVYYGKLMIIK